MSDLIKIEPEYVYVTIPAEYICVYHRILAMLADFGEEMLKDCKAACTQHNSDVVDCFNMFNAAVAARKLNKEKLAETLIKYIKAKINQIYKGADNSTDFVFPIDEDGQLKAFVSCGELPEFWINPDDMELYEHKLGNGFDEHFELSEEDFSPEGDDTEDNVGLTVEFRGIIEKESTDEYYHPCVELRVLYNGNEVYDYTAEYYFCKLECEEKVFMSYDKLKKICVDESGNYSFGVGISYNGEYKIISKVIHFDYITSTRNNDNIITSDTKSEQESEAKSRYEESDENPVKDPPINTQIIFKKLDYNAIDNNNHIHIEVRSKVRLYFGGLYWGEDIHKLNGVRISDQRILDLRDESWKEGERDENGYRIYTYHCAPPDYIQLDKTVLKTMYGRAYVRTTMNDTYADNRVYSKQIFQCYLDVNNKKQITIYDDNY